MIQFIAVNHMAVKMKSSPCINICISAEERHRKTDAFMVAIKY